MISLDEALALLLEGAGPRGFERVPLDHLAGRCLAEDVTADHDQPAEPRSLMDGIAVASGAPGRFVLVGESRAGAPFGASLGGDQAVTIATGAVVPGGATQVIPREMVMADGAKAVVEEWPSASFIRPAGSDFARGDLLLARGTRLGPASVMLLAAANRDSALVAPRPRVAILAGGDELVPPGQALATGRSIDSVSFGLAALCRAWGAVVTRLPAVGDALDMTIEAMRAGLADADILVTIGGASVGEHDLMRPAAAAIGAAMRFERINVQPGKPSWHARLPDGKTLLGLPGNPTSAIVCAHLLLRPLLEVMEGAQVRDREMEATLAAALNANGQREQFVRAARVSEPGDAARLVPLGNQDSGLQAALVKATHLIRQAPGDGGGPPGSTVRAIPLEA